MKLSIITTTIGRPSLLNLIEALRSQTNRDFEHIIVPDVQHYNDYGHSVRRDAVRNAQGEYILYIDDDDSIIPQGVELILKGLELNNYPNFMIFPCLREGEVFFNIPPGFCRTTSIQYAHKRIINNELISFDSGGYGEDSKWIEKMTQKHGYRAYACEPITIVNHVP